MFSSLFFLFFLVSFWVTPGFLLTLCSETTLSGPQGTQRVLGLESGLVVCTVRALPAVISLGSLIMLIILFGVEGCTPSGVQPWGKGENRVLLG